MSQTLEVNAASEEHPMLSAFRPELHKCILLDEAPARMVAMNRKLFQAPNAFVQVAQSKTSCHSYSVYLNDTLIVICSNSWEEHVSRMDTDGRNWIEANQVLARVTSPLWVERARPESKTKNH